ncbi:MAG: ribosome silencing factor, partial [Alphaproteobacteria bacterium]|nr:ribosome silencing factor [Alphaproteobacteria bacterium]
SRQLGALAEYLREAFFKLGVKRLRVEGVQQRDWVLIDAGDVIIHIFRPEVRSFYQIEDVWSPEKKES